jgi:hypothetical protein
MPIYRSAVELKQKDFDSGVSSVSFFGDHVEVGSANAAAIETLQVALVGALENIVTGTTLHDELAARRTVPDDLAPPTSPLSQTNIRWRVTYSDDVTGRTFTQTIPCADLSLGVKSGDETILDLSTGAGQAFKTAFDAYVVSEDGNACTLEKCVYVQ